MRKLVGLLLISVLFCACGKLFEDEPDYGYLDYLPKKTQEGANTFGCLINGEIAASKGDFQKQGVKLSETWWYQYVNGFWYGYSNSNNLEKADTIMQFRILLKQATLYMEYYSLQKDIHECGFYIKFSNYPGLSGSAVTTVNITKLDRQNQIISGEFDSIDIPLYEIDSIVQLKKGRFDIKYGTNF